MRIVMYCVNGEYTNPNTVEPDEETVAALFDANARNAEDLEPAAATQNPDAPVPVGGTIVIDGVTYTRTS